MQNAEPARKAPYRAYNAFNMVSWTVGAKAANTINVAAQLKEARGQTPAQPLVFDFFLSDSSDGHTLTATATTSALAVHTNGVLLVTPVSGKMGTALTDTQGRFDLDIIQTASSVTYYLAVRLPDGSLAASPAITF